MLRQDVKVRSTLTGGDSLEESLAQLGQEMQVDVQYIRTGTSDKPGGMPLRRGRGRALAAWQTQGGTTGRGHAGPRRASPQPGGGSLPPLPAQSRKRSRDNWASNSASSSPLLPCTRSTCRFCAACSGGINSAMAAGFN